MIQSLVKLFTNPQEYWREAVTEPGDIKALLVPKMAILAAIPAVAAFLGLVFGFIRFGFLGAFVGGLASMVLSYVMNIVMWVALGFIIDALAPSFGGQRDIGQSMKLATGTVIPMWLGSALSITSVGALGWLGWLAGLGYGAYALYLGLPVMNGTSREKAVGYTAASIGILFVVSLVAGMLAACPASCLIRSSLPGHLAY
jgi:hypothetical protein